MKAEKHFELAITYRSVDSLKPNPRNARSHSKHQLRQIADSIEAFGFANPILVDKNSIVIAGHGRLSAAKLLGLESVPTIQLEHLTDDEIRALMISDNRLAEIAGWDKEILKIEFQHLMNIDIGPEITITGFEIPEIDLIIGGPASSKPDANDQFELDESALPATQEGDLWILGRHRVLCGNALEADSYKTLMGPRRAALVFSDPPFNVPIRGHASGHGMIKHREFAMASGEMSEPEFVAFLSRAFGLLSKFSSCGSVHFICSDWRHLSEFMLAAKPVYNSLLNLCVWAKNSPGLGSFYRSQHELVFVYRNGKNTHRNNVQLGQFGRTRSNVWQYPSANTFSKNGDEGNLLHLHPTVKPVALVADALLDCSARGDLVLDNFLGSGTTLIAAERVGRSCCGLELDPLYVDVAIRRWQRLTGDLAVHALSGKRFDDLAAVTEVNRVQK